MRGNMLVVLVRNPDIHAVLSRINMISQFACKCTVATDMLYQQFAINVDFCLLSGGAEAQIEALG